MQRCEASFLVYCGFQSQSKWARRQKISSLYEILENLIAFSEEEYSKSTQVWLTQYLKSKHRSDDDCTYIFVVFIRIWSVVTLKLHLLFFQVESFILDQEDLENPMLETASKLLLSSTADGADLRTVDPETQARLEALLEAAGKYSCPIQV